MADARRVADNLQLIRDRIAAAAARSGRAAEDVQLVAVTKYAELADVRALAAAGCRAFGESRPQQLWQRAVALSDLPIEWHLIGHLQRNKAPRTIEVATLIQSCDSVRLAQAINEAAAERSAPVSVLLEVNIAEDPAKHGFSPAEIADVLPAIAALPRLSVRGLMAMAGRADDPAAARGDFRRLRQLRDRLHESCPPEISLDELSMGMSGDFEIGIEEGATIVRVGSALFEESAS